MIKRLKAPTTQLMTKKEQPGAALSFFVIQLTTKKIEALITELMIKREQPGGGLSFFVIQLITKRLETLTTQFMIKSLNYKTQETKNQYT